MADADDNIIRRIRNQVPDTDAIYGDDGEDYLFDDDAIKDFYSDASEMHPQSAVATNIIRAAAYAKLAVGASEGIISKVIRTQDLSTNGAALMDSFTNQGKEMLARADKIDLDTTSTYFEIVDYNQYDPRPELTEWNWSYGR